MECRAAPGVPGESNRISIATTRTSSAEETRETFNGYAEKYFDSLRVCPTTLAGYRKHFRVHVLPSTVGRTPIALISKDQLNRFYRQLELNGRKDRGHIGARSALRLFGTSVS